MKQLGAVLLPIYYMESTVFALSGHSASFCPYEYSALRVTCLRVPAMTPLHSADRRINLQLLPCIFGVRNDGWWGAWRLQHPNSDVVTGHVVSKCR